MRYYLFMLYDQAGWECEQTSYDYKKFMEDLKEEGFERFSKTVHTKSFSSQASAEAGLKRLAKSVPRTISVKLLIISEKQFARIVKI